MSKEVREFLEPLIMISKCFVKNIDVIGLNPVLTFNDSNTGYWHLPSGFRSKSFNEGLDWNLYFFYLKHRIETCLYEKGILSFFIEKKITSELIPLYYELKAKIVLISEVGTNFTTSNQNWEYIHNNIGIIELIYRTINYLVEYGNLNISESTKVDFNCRSSAEDNDSIIESEGENEVKVKIFIEDLIDQTSKENAFDYFSKKDYSTFLKYVTKTFVDKDYCVPDDIHLISIKTNSGTQLLRIFNAVYFAYPHNEVENRGSCKNFINLLRTIKVFRKWHEEGTLIKKLSNSPIKSRDGKNNMELVFN